MRFSLSVMVSSLSLISFLCDWMSFSRENMVSYRRASLSFSRLISTFCWLESLTSDSCALVMTECVCIKRMAVSPSCLSFESYRIFISATSLSPSISVSTCTPSKATLCCSLTRCRSFCPYCSASSFSSYSTVSSWRYFWWLSTKAVFSSFQRECASSVSSCSTRCLFSSALPLVLYFSSMFFSSSVWCSSRDFTFTAKSFSMDLFSSSSSANLSLSASSWVLKRSSISPFLSTCSRSLRRSWCSLFEFSSPTFCMRVRICPLRLSRSDL
mmetsp:Transcript_5883/g.12978  ORF Transcript_5883/g.12978 Transcript_5883/m.12978 type:complete len:270 (-) Transcript_5883:2154-2963(-)